MTIVRNLHACILCQVQYSKNGLILHFSLYIFISHQFQQRLSFLFTMALLCDKGHRIHQFKARNRIPAPAFLQEGLSFPRWKKFLTLKGREYIRSRGLKQFGPHLHHNVSIRWAASFQLHLPMSSYLAEQVCCVSCLPKSHIWWDPGDRPFLLWHLSCGTSSPQDEIGFISDNLPEVLQDRVMSTGLGITRE